MSHTHKAIYPHHPDPRSHRRRSARSSRSSMKLSLSREDMLAVQKIYQDEGPRADGRGAGSHRPDVERALQAPHLQREDLSHAWTARQEVGGQPVQDLHPQRHAGDHEAEAGLRAQRFRRQRGLREARRRQGRVPEGRDAQSPERHRAVCRREHRPRRCDPRHSRRGQGREAGGVARCVLLWPARHEAGGHQGQGRDSSARRHARRGARRARLRQPHGHSHGERRDPVRRHVHLQSARLLRHGGRDPDQGHRQGSEARAFAHRRRWSHGQGRAQGRDVFSSASLTTDSHEEDQTAVQIGNPIEEKKVADFVLAARERGLDRVHHRLRRGRILQRGGRDAQRNGRRGLAGELPAERAGPRELAGLHFSESPGAHGPGRRGEESARAAKAGRHLSRREIVHARESRRLEHSQGAASRRDRLRSAMCDKLHDAPRREMRAQWHQPASDDCQP